MSKILDSLHHAADAVRHAAMEDDAPVEVTPTKAASRATVYTPPATFSTPVHDNNVSYAPADASTSSKYYQILLEKTNPCLNLAPVLQRLFGLAKPLENIIPDRTTRMRAALAQASAADPTCTVEAVTSGIQILIQTLQNENAAFQNEIENKKKDISQKQLQATTLEKQLHDLRVEISEKTSKIDQSGIEFQSAFTHRNSELEQLKSESLNWR